MSAAIRAIYEGGMLRPLDPLNLPEHAVVTISLDSGEKDTVRQEWLDQSQRALMEVWGNEADDVYNALLTQ